MDQLTGYDDVFGGWMGCSVRAPKVRNTGVLADQAFKRITRIGGRDLDIMGLG